MMEDGPRFPPELEREIFVTTAQLHPKMSPTLLRVARRVLYWIEPTLYNMVSIGGLEEKQARGVALLHAIDTKPSGFFSRAVRHLALAAFHWSFMDHPQNPWSDAELGKVLRACPGVVNLVLVGDLIEPPVLPMLSDMRPKRLLMAVDVMNPQLKWTLPLFRNVSHLCLFDINATDPVEWPQLRNLARLPSLTHLGVYRTSPDILSAILSDYATLRVVLILCENTFTAKTLASEQNSLHDPRVVFSGMANILQDWVPRIESGEDIWAHIDDFILRKKRGEIDDVWSEAELSCLLPSCTGVVSLTLVGDLLNPWLLPMIMQLKPTHLALAANIDIGHNSNPRSFKLPLPLFRNISHLHLFDAEVLKADTSISANWQYCSKSYPASPLAEEKLQRRVTT
ncbi:hypothetical protein C8R44DRAFT_979169 [Mycena epipterygia]|nr:hypothetical protein C8R44DRAFT_979169 [Mycena epipterygia]